MTARALDRPDRNRPLLLAAVGWSLGSQPAGVRRDSRPQRHLPRAVARPLVRACRDTSTDADPRHRHTERARGQRNVTSEAVEQHRGPDGSLERKSLEDRGVRLARLRGRRARDRACRRAEEHRPGRHERRPVEAGRPHPARRRLPGRPADRDHRRAEREPDRERRGVPRHGRRRGRLGRVFDDDQESALAARARSRRPDLGRRAHGDDPVRHEGRRTRSRPRTSTRSRPPPTRSRTPIRASSSARPARSAPGRRSTRRSTSSSRRPASGRSRSR